METGTGQHLQVLKHGLSLEEKARERAQASSSQRPDFKAHCQLPHTREYRKALLKLGKEPLLPTPKILLTRTPRTNTCLIVTPCQGYSSLPCGPCSLVRIPSASESIPLPISKSTPIPARDRGRCKTPGVRERCLAGRAIQCLAHLIAAGMEEGCVCWPHVREHWPALRTNSQSRVPDVPVPQPLQGKILVATSFTSGRYPSGWGHPE